MSNEKTNDSAAGEAAEPVSPLAHRRRNRRGLIVGAIATPLALGAVGLSLARPGQAFMPTPVAPSAISALTPSAAIAVKGEVAEVFGNKFVLQDGTGRALIETGREGEDGKLVAKGETVTVQGRFETGFLHATLITRADGKQVVIGHRSGPVAGTSAWARDVVGLGPKVELAALTAEIEKAGYGDIRVIGRGPRHLEVAAKASDGSERLLHVDFDGHIREQSSL